MTIWVPGKNGLLGSEIAQHTDLPVLETSREEVDISSYSQVENFLKEHQEITQIINAAAYSLVDPAETEKEKAFSSNVKGPENLAKASRKQNIHLIHISTDYVFEGKGNTPLKETDPTNPCNYYGKTKLEGEKRVLEENKDAFVLRTSWIFGKKGRNFMASLLRKLREDTEIRLTNNQWGRPTFAEDLAKVLLKVKTRSGLYQFANQGITTKFLFGCEMRDQMEKMGLKTKANLISVPSNAFSSPAKRPVYSAFDTTKIEKDLHIEIRSWQEALRDYLCSLFAPSTVSL